MGASRSEGGNLQRPCRLSSHHMSEMTPLPERLRRRSGAACRSRGGGPRPALLAPFSNGGNDLLGSARSGTASATQPRSWSGAGAGIGSASPAACVGTGAIRHHGTVIGRA